MGRPSHSHSHSEGEIQIQKGGSLKGRSRGHDGYMSGGSGGHHSSSSSRVGQVGHLAFSLGQKLAWLGSNLHQHGGLFSPDWCSGWAMIPSVPIYVNKAKINKIRAFPEQVLSKKNRAKQNFYP